MKLMKAIVFFIFVVIMPSMSIAQQTTKKLFYIGHSLINIDMPTMVHGLAMDSGVGHAHDHETQIINVAPLRRNWDNGATTGSGGQGIGSPVTFARDLLDTEDYTDLIMTEGIPLATDMVQYGGNFHQLANAANADIQTYMLETWHWTTPNPMYDYGSIDWFNQNIEAQYQIDIANYDQIDLLERHKSLRESRVEAINAAYPQHREMIIIPAGQVLLRVHEEIQAGGISGFNSINQLFSDNIHMNDIGNYLVALSVYAAVYEQSPVGLTNQLKNMWGGDYNPPTPAQADTFQRLVWEVISDYILPTSQTFYSITTAVLPSYAGNIECVPNPVPSGGSKTCTVLNIDDYQFQSFSGACSGLTCTLSNVEESKYVAAKFIPTNDTGFLFSDGFE